MSHSRHLTIFEGCDGGGKTTAAKRYALDTGARYVHFSAMPRVGAGLARMYVEAMLPALLGYQDVVFDRSWISEVPYGTVFREGNDRLGDHTRRMLDRLAMRCGGLIVHCDPGLETCQANFNSRKHLEMLADTAQLDMVHALYPASVDDSELPAIRFNYRVDTYDQLTDRTDNAEGLTHDLRCQTVGSWTAGFVLVGDSFAEPKDQDPFLQYPFMSFSKAGCSQWLTSQLAAEGIKERDLCWANADDPGLPVVVEQFKGARFVALGAQAETALGRLGVRPTTVPHPQYWKRFQGGERYPLGRLLARGAK